MHAGLGTSLAVQDKECAGPCLVCALRDLVPNVQDVYQIMSTCSTVQLCAASDGNNAQLVQAWSGRNMDGVSSVMSAN